MRAPMRNPRVLPSWQHRSAGAQKERRSKPPQSPGNGERGTRAAKHGRRYAHVTHLRCQPPSADFLGLQIPWPASLRCGSGVAHYQCGARVLSMIGIAVIMASVAVYMTNSLELLFWFWAHCTAAALAALLVAFVKPEWQRRRTIIIWIEGKHEVQYAGIPGLTSAKVLTLPLLIGVSWLGSAIGYV